MRCVVRRPVTAPSPKRSRADRHVGGPTPSMSWGRAGSTDPGYQRATAAEKSLSTGDDARCAIRLRHRSAGYETVMPNPQDPQDPMRQAKRLADAEEAAGKARGSGGRPSDAKRRLAEDPDQVPNATDPDGEPNTDAGHTSRQHD